MTVPSRRTDVPAWRITVLVSSIFRDTAAQLRGLEAVCLALAETETADTRLRSELQQLDLILQMLADGQRVSDVLSDTLPAGLAVPVATLEAAIHLEEVFNRLKAGPRDGHDPGPLTAAERVELF